MARNRTNGGHPEYAELGDRLRVARTARGLSLRSLADRLGVSPSLISQVERGRARPSVNTLYAMARELDVSFDELLFPDVTPTTAHADVPPAQAGRAAEPWPLAAPPIPVQQGGNRRTIRLASGVTWERLTTESIPNADFLYVTYEVGGASSPEHEFQRHGGLEWGYVMSGRLGVTIGFDEHLLEAGDAVAFDSTVPHRLFNAGAVPVHAIWFVLGRGYADAGASPRPHGGPASS